MLSQRLHQSNVQFSYWSRDDRKSRDHFNASYIRNDNVMFPEQENSLFHSVTLIVTVKALVRVILNKTTPLFLCFH